MHWLIKSMVDIFISVRDDSDNDIAKGAYRPKKNVLRRCDMCSEIPIKIYRYKSAYLCEKCYLLTVKKFGEVHTKKK